jgi:hypothetical protein
MYVSFHFFKPGPSLPNQALTEAFSIAIWNKNKFAVAFAVIMWVTNVSVVIQGKSLPFYPPATIENLIPHGFVLGVTRVNDQSQLLWTTKAYLSAASGVVEPFVANLCHAQQRADQAYLRRYRRQ